MRPRDVKEAMDQLRRDAHATGKDWLGTMYMESMIRVGMENELLHKLNDVLKNQPKEPQ